MTFHVNCPAMTLDKPVTDRKTKTCPATLLLRCKERLEYQLALRFGNPAAGVLHGYRDPRIGIVCGFVLLPGRKRESSALRHSVQCIEQEVEKHLLHLLGVGVNVWHATLKIFGNVNAGLACTLFDER